MLADLASGTPAGVDEALALVDGLDDALCHGLARVDDDRATALESLAAAFEGSPLAGRVGESVRKIVAGAISDEYLIGLAGARTALLGAVHDALLAQVDTALGRTREEYPAPAAGDVDPASGSRASDQVLDGSLSWLRELAITGWRGVDHDLAGAGSSTAQALLPDLSRRRLAVLLDGFAGELRATAPIDPLQPVPVRRWADLWARSVLLSQPGAATGPAPVPVDGRLLPLGVDLHEHPTVFQAQVHGVLEPAAGPARLVRTSVAAAKVDTISGAAAWRMLADFPVLRAALAGQRAVDVTGMLLTTAGDLLWAEAAASPADPADTFAAARIQLPDAVASSAAPLDRHPAALAEPVLLERYAATGTAFELGPASFAVDTYRLPAAGPLTPAVVGVSTACIGLLRWDGRWSVQPLAVTATVKKKPVAVRTADWALGPTDPKAAKAEALDGTAVQVLRERAGRLLRR
jgi:hypothetical protein